MVAADSSSQPLGPSAAVVFFILSLLVSVLLGLLLYAFDLHESSDGLLILTQLLSWVLVTAFVIRFYRGSLKQSYAMASARPVWLLLGAGCGLSMGWFPSWLVTTLDERLQSVSLGHLEKLETLFSSGSSSQRVWLFIAVVFAAPLCEELIFRGFLWRCLRSSLGPLWTLVATSLLFAAYHFDPLHIIGILPIAFVLGFLRLTSGAIWPCVLAHFLNNLIGACLASFDEQTSTSGAVAFSGVLVTLALIGLAWSWYKRNV